MAVAKLIDWWCHDNYGGHVEVRMYSLDPPLEGYSEVIASASCMPWPDGLSRELHAGMGIHGYLVYETYIFGVNPGKGDPRHRVNIGNELPGSQRGTLDHEIAIMDAGYTIARF